MLLSSFVISQQELLQLWVFFYYCGEVGEVIRIFYQSLLILVEIMLQLLVGMYVVDKLKHYLDLFICAVTLIGLYYQREVHLFSLPWYIGTSPP